MNTLLKIITRNTLEALTADGPSMSDVDVRLYSWILDRFSMPITIRLSTISHFLAVRDRMIERVLSTDGRARWTIGLGTLAPLTGKRLVDDTRRHRGCGPVVSRRERDRVCDRRDELVERTVALTREASLDSHSLVRHHSYVRHSPRPTCSLSR